MTDLAQYMPRHSGIVARALAMFRRDSAAVKRPVQIKAQTHVRPQAPRMYAIEAQRSSAVVMIGRMGRDLTRAADCLRSQGETVLFCNGLSEVRSRVWLDNFGTVHQVSHILVDIDALGGIAAIYAELRRIRNAIPDLAVILMSAEFSVDDYSVERLALCDASIRANFTFAGLEFAYMESVEINNKIWQSRVAELAAAAEAPRYDMSNVVHLHQRRA